jgi:hypothetical protein
MILYFREVYFEIMYILVLQSIEIIISYLTDLTSHTMIQLTITSQ